MGPKRSIVKLADADIHTVELTSPVLVEGEVVTRFSKAKFPLVQVEEVTFEMDGGEISFLCTEEYANFVASAEEQVATIISEKSVEWFGKVITCDQCEKMLRSALDGNKNPKHHASGDTLKVFDHEEKPVEHAPHSGVAVPILRIEGVVFHEKHCELLWSAVQMKLAEDVSQDDVDPDGWVGN